MSDYHRVKVAVIGAGSMGRNHLRVYDNLKGVELVGVFDINDKLAEASSVQHNCRKFISMEEAAKSVDAVSICSPSVTHEEIGVYFMERGVHCLVEKPLATTEKGCKALIAKAKENDIVLLVGHIERFNPAVQQVLALLEADLNVIAVACRRLSSVSQRITDVDVIADLMVHDLDIVRAISKGDVTAIQAASAGEVKNQNHNHVTALLSFSSGSVATVTSSRLTQQTVRDLSVVTDDGVISVNYYDQSVEVHQRDSYREQSGNLAKFGPYVQDTSIERIQVRRTEPLQVELSHFIECIQTGLEPEVTGEQALEALRLVWGIQENLKK